MLKSHANYEGKTPCPTIFDQFGGPNALFDRLRTGFRLYQPDPNSHLIPGASPVHPYFAVINAGFSRCRFL